MINVEDIVMDADSNKAFIIKKSDQKIAQSMLDKLKSYDEWICSIDNDDLNQIKRVFSDPLEFYNWFKKTLTFMIP